MTDSDDADDDSAPLPSRDEVLGMLDDAMQECHRKATDGRVRDAENERVRQGWVRQLGYLANSYRQLKKDEDLEELSERLDRLEQRDSVDSSILPGEA